MSNPAVTTTIPVTYSEIVQNFAPPFGQTTPYTILGSNPGILLSPSESGGVIQEIIEVGGATWIAYNAVYNVNTAGLTPNTWYQQNTALPSWAFEVGPGSITEWFAAATLTGMPTAITFVEGALTINATSIVFTGSITGNVTITGNLSVTGNFSFGGTYTSPVPEVFPQGRLTLTSNTPVMTADVNNAGTIYYTPFNGTVAPIYNGTSSWTQEIFSQLTLVLDSTHHTSGSVHDVFLFLNSGVLTIVAGPAWTSTTTRGTGATTTQIQQQNGLWVNTVSMTAYNNNVSYTVPALQGLYIGSFYCNAAASVTMNFSPSPAAQGSANIFGLYNAYNRVRLFSEETTSATVGVAVANTWQQMGTTSTITFLDGLQQSALVASIEGDASIAASNNGRIGVNIDSTTATPTRVFAVFAVAAGGPTNVNFMHARYSFFPVLGLHVLSAMSYGSSTNTANVEFNSTTDNVMLMEMDN
jgi:hypothetical protein